MALFGVTTQLRDCRDPEGAMDAGRRMVKALLAGRAVGATDLVEVRECARSAVEALKGGEVKVKVSSGKAYRTSYFGCSTSHKMYPTHCIAFGGLNMISTNLLVG